MIIMNYLQILKPRILVLLVIVCAGISKAAAQTEINVTSTAVPFLRISPDTRAGGMANLGLATAADAGGVFYNRAKLPFAAADAGVAFSYSPWLRDLTSGIYLLSGSFYKNLADDQTLSAGIRYFNMGDLPMADYSGNKLPSAQPSEMAVDLGYSRKLSSTIGIAVALRYIHSKLVSGSMDGVNYKAGNAVASDLSLYYTRVDSTKGGWSAGIALSNLGSKISYTSDDAQKAFLPANLGIGIAYTGVVDEDNQITVGIDYNHLLVPNIPADALAATEYYNKSVTEGWFSSFDNKQNTVSLGAEYVYRRRFSVRAGYLIVPKAAGDNGGFTTGLGIKLSLFDVHFAYQAAAGNGVTRNPLSNTVRFGLNFNW